MLVNLLRLLPPETAHEITIKLLKSNLNFNRKHIKIYKSLNQTILGINFRNPISLLEAVQDHKKIGKLIKSARIKNGQLPPGK